MAFFYFSVFPGNNTGNWYVWVCQIWLNISGLLGLGGGMLSAEFPYELLNILYIYIIVYNRADTQVHSCQDEENIIHTHTRATCSAGVCPCLMLWWGGGGGTKHASDQTRCDKRHDTSLCQQQNETCVKHKFTSNWTHEAHVGNLHCVSSGYSFTEK